MVNGENTRISVTTPKAIYKLLQKEADYDDRSISNLVLKIIKEHYGIKNEDD